MATRWVRVVGDGLVYTGPCVVFHIVVWPDANGDYADVYDGHDTSTGKKFCRIECPVQLTEQVSLVPGVPFDRGIYVDGKDSAVETTIIFEPIRK
jgi:hypothetical protein